MMIRSFILTTALASFAFFGAPQIAQAEEVMCTMDAKLCPDGSSVGRTGPNCEFAACPGEETDDDGSTDDGTDHMDGDDDDASMPGDDGTADDGTTDDVEHEIE